MWKYVRPYLHFGILAALCMVGEVLADLAQPTLMSQVVDEGVLGSSGLDAIFNLGAAMVGVAVLGGICGSANCAFANLCIQNIGNRMRKDCFARIMSFSVAQIERFGAGTLITRTTNDVNQVAMMIQTFIRGMIRTGMLMFGSIICVYMLNPAFGVIMLACFPIALAVMMLTLRKVSPLYARIQSALDKLNAIMQEDLNGIRVIKACVRETHEKLKFGTANADLVKHQLKALVIFAFLNPSMSMLMYAAIGVMLALGQSGAQAGLTSAGVVIAALTYVTQLLNSMLSLIMISQDLSRGAVSWRRLHEILSTEPDIVDGNRAPSAEGPEKAGASLAFRHVSFSYPESTRKALDDVSFTVEPGQTVGIMGATGSGKSTLAALACRLFDASEGEVLVDGADVRSWNQTALRSRVALALQRAELFSISVNDTITWGAASTDSPSSASAREAARIAQADAFVNAMEEGYDTILAERGMSLSGGQRQRLLLARAIAQAKGAIIFDDATSALDLRTEADFYACLKEARPHLTKIIVAQRVASVRHADKIVVLEAGRVVGCGTHDELLESCPAYREICLSQYGEDELGANTSAQASPQASPLVEAQAEAQVPASAAPRFASTKPAPQPMLPGAPRRREMSSEPEQAKNLRSTLSRVVRYFAAEGSLTAGVIAFVVAGVAFGCAAPSLQSNVVDIIAGQSDADFAFALALMLAAYLLYAACQLGDTWLSAHLSQRIVSRLRNELFGKIMDLPIRYLDEHSHGDVMSRMTNDVETISQTISKSLASLISAALTIVGTAAVMLAMCWQLALLSFSTIILTLVATRLISRGVLKYSRLKQQLLGQLNGTTEEMINGFRTVIVCNRQGKTTHDFAATSDAFTSACLRAWILSGCMGPIMNCISNIGFVIIAIFGGWLSYAGIITVGVISAFIVYARQFSRPVNALAQLYGDLQTAIACAERVFAVLDQESEHMAGLPPVEQDQATIEFRQVSFGYSPDTPVLHDFSLTIPSGKKVALVGATGSGKTTVVNLLERFYDVDEGQILVNGQDIATLARDELRRHMAIVLQDTMLFTDTIDDNLRFANEHASEADIARALELTRTDALVSALPHGLDTVLSHAGENLSQGQRQLLSIARAFVANPRILILDEATSSVDTRTEKIVQDAMAAVMKGRTCVIIAHRLSTIRDADLIVVLDDGRIVETGTHAQLLTARGRYYQLHQAQFEGFAT